MVKYWYIATHTLRKFFRRLYYRQRVVYVSDGDKCPKCHGRVEYIPGFKNGHMILENRTGHGNLQCLRCGNKDIPYIQIDNEWPYDRFKKGAK